MNKTLIRLAERRERLVVQTAAQRVQLAQDVEPLRLPLARADQGLAALRYIKRHPALMVGGGILLATLRLGRLGKWLQRGWVAWQAVHKLRGK